MSNISFFDNIPFYVSLMPAVRQLTKKDSLTIKSFCNLKRNALFVVKNKRTIVKFCLQEFQIR